MSLNIKNPRVHRLAREAAHITGKTQTGAIEEALEQFLEAHGVDLERDERERKQKHILELIESVRQTPSDSTFTVDDLYDPETGLPA